MPATRSLLSSVARSPDDPPVWNRPEITFVSICPKCGHQRFQHGYSRRTLFYLPSERRRIDAGCSDCNGCWPIRGKNRRMISPQ